MSNDDERILTPLSNLVFEHFSLAELDRLQEICNSNADKDCNGIPDWIANVSLRLKDSSRKEQTEYSKLLVGKILYIERTGIRQARSSEHIDSNMTEVLLKLEKEIESSDWLSLIGEYYPFLDYTSFLTGRVMTHAKNNSRIGPIRELMSPFEFCKLQSLSYPLRVYRGCFKDANEDGLSYSLNQKTAEEIAWNFWDHSLPVVINVNSADVELDQIAAYKAFRYEDEILLYETPEWETLYQPEIP